MGKRLTGCLVALVTLSVFPALGRADSCADSLGKAISDFRLPDTGGRTVRLSDFKDKLAVVVVFIGTECPINNFYMPRLAELNREYAPKGVQFLAINANVQDSRADILKHAQKYRLPFPVLKDEKNVIADRFGARRTPEAYLLDRDRKVRYQGRIDDQYGINYRRPRPTRRDLAAALDEVLAGKAVSRPAAPAAGCMIARAAVAPKDGPVTFTRHVARILQKNCQECHRPGQIGPMSLLTYEDAASWSATIKEVIEEGRMPPWDADPRYGKFSNDRRLSARDKQTLLTWIKQGTPRGEVKDLPSPRRFDPTWRIGKPDVIITMPKAFEVPAKMPKYGVPYKYFTVDPGFKEDMWVVKAEARPGATEVVHHLIVFIVPPGATFFPGSPETPALCGTAPGDMPTLMPEGMAKKVPKGSKLVFQMHYTPNGTAQKDRSSIGLVFARRPPRMYVRAEPVFNLGFRIPPGAAKHRVEAWYTFRRDGYIVGFMPHMHLRGKDFLYEALYPDGRKEILLSVPRYNFNWQSIYRPAEPLRMPKGTRLHCVAHFDNSANNPNNPDPTRAVSWGDQTWEEMMVGWTDFAFDLPKKGSAE